MIDYDYHGPDRRRYKRIYKIFGVSIIEVGNKKTLPKFAEEMGLNLSEGGLLIECSENLVRGTHLRLRLMLNIDAKYVVIETAAKARWSKKSYRNTYFIGCKFTHLAAKDHKLIRKFCNS